MAVVNITNSPAEVDWTTERGATFYRDFTVRDGDNENSPPLDLTDYVFEMFIYDVRAAVVATLEIGSGITVTPADGYVQIYVEPDDTATWPDCELRFKMWWTVPAAGDVPELRDLIIKGVI